MRTVLASRFRDAHGVEHICLDQTDDEFRKFHTSRNRKHYEIGDIYCVWCDARVFPVEQNGVRFVRHEAGKSHAKCEYADFVARLHGPSPLHREAAATIGISVRGMQAWNAEPEKRIDAGRGVIVIPDVYAWHDTAKAPPVMHEVQLSAQTIDETMVRAERHQWADPTAKTFWWANDAGMIGPQRGCAGVVIDRALRVVSPAYKARDERVSLTVGQAAKLVTRDRNPWAVIQLEQGEMALAPMDIGSTLQRARPPRGTRLTSELPVEVGCERPATRPNGATQGAFAADGFDRTDETKRRPERPRPQRVDSSFCPADGCGLTATDGSIFCWRHAKDDR